MNILKLIKRRKYIVKITVPGVVLVTSLVVAVPVLGSEKSSLYMVYNNLDHLLVVPCVDMDIPLRYCALTESTKITIIVFMDDK